MKKQKKTMQNGITLIALVISIIVMLILAGVSINAIIGDNGILSRTQYATFINEMTAVEEAVQMWKAGEIIEAQGQDTKVIPTNGLCNATDLKTADRLSGEVGFYRTWSLTEIVPETSVFTNTLEFNSKFEGELVFYPAGVQDLYYLNNEAIGIKGDKKYLIDASTGMIYSMIGIGLKGVTCYSTNMATAVMSGTLNAPAFAEAEVSGSSTGDKLAGNTGPEYIEDKNGNLIKNPEYNPNGFKIIADAANNNIYKLYNTGELYGKGIKGRQLNTSKEEMEKINSYIWKEFNIPAELKDINKIIIGVGNIFFIDNSGNLFVYGTYNANNKLGLTDEQLIEYTGRDLVKINLEGRKVTNVFGGMNQTFIIAGNELLAAGLNTNGQLGLGDTHITTTFEIVPGINNVQNIKNIFCTQNEGGAALIEYEDNTFYFAGVNNGVLGIGSTGETYHNFTQIWNTEDSLIKDYEVEDIILNSDNILLKKDGTVYLSGYTGYQGGGLEAGSNSIYRKYTNLSDVKSIEIVGHSALYLIERADGKTELYGLGSISNYLGSDYYNIKEPVKMELPESLEKEGIKEIYGCQDGAFYILSKTGKLYGTGAYNLLGLNNNSGYTKGIIYLEQNGIDCLYNENMGYVDNSKSVLLLNRSGKFYFTGNSVLMFKNEILQKNWTLVANNVKYYSASDNCYVDKDGVLYVSGDSRFVGMGDTSDNYRIIENYEACTDLNIYGKVKKCWTAGSITYVLLEDNTVWATGLYNYNGRNYYPGWEDKEDKYTFVKILDNIILFEAKNYYARFGVTNTGTVKAWGTSFCGNTGNPKANGNIPYEYSFPAEVGGGTNVKKIYSYKDSKTFLVTKTGDLFITGNQPTWSYDGGATQNASWTRYTYKLNFAEDEIITDTVAINGINVLLLTNMGRVFGWGNALHLGINNSSSTLIETMEMTALKNIEQIVCGAGWYIAIDKDGKVYGTGSNIYGVLGRWKGAPRTSGRYRTAFEWVECPELEI